MYTRQHPRNNMLICGVGAKGGVTKAFETEEGLAQHIFKSMVRGGKTRYEPWTKMVNQPEEECRTKILLLT